MNSPQPPNQASAEPAPLALSARYVRWRTPLVGTLMGLSMLGLGGFVILMSQHLAQEKAQESLERSLLRQAQDMVKFRNFYASEIMAPAQAHGVRVSHDFKDQPGTLPLPATMVLELGRFFNQQEKGSQTHYFKIGRAHV